MLCHCAALLLILARMCTATMYQEMLETEDILLDQMQRHIAAEEVKISELRARLSEMRRLHEEAVLMTSLDPISAYLLTRRLAVDWNLVLDDVPSDTMTTDDLQAFPTHETFTDAARTLFRLQDVYDVEAAELAQGEIQGVKYTRAMSSSECLWMGLEAMRANESAQSSAWFQQTLRRHHDEPVKTTDLAEVLDYLASAVADAGDLEAALKLSDQLLEVSPSNEEAKLDRAHYIADLEASAVLDGMSDDDAYEQLCRGVTLMKPSVASRLKCRYVHHDLPYLLIGPFKLEEVSASPAIFLYHDVVGDAEGATLRRLAAPGLAPAETYGAKGRGVVSSARIALSVQINSSRHRHVDDVDRRTRYMTKGLNPATSDSLQVVQYGVGGQYIPHYDFPVVAYTEVQETHGSKMVNVLFYLNDVIRGGATVFPRVGVAIQPRRGSAAFWYNLHDDGRGDLRTLHAGCPVLVGDKWIANKWFHVEGQEFTRPCRKDSLNVKVNRNVSGRKLHR